MRRVEVRYPAMPSRRTSFPVLLMVCSVLLLAEMPWLIVRAQGAVAAIKISTRAQIAADLDLCPCKDSLRYPMIRELFQKMGAQEQELELQTFGKENNLIVRIKGKSDRFVVVGAHFDKVSIGCGAVDNWTGVVAVAHLYASLRATSPEAGLVFVAFAAEEEGLVGSEAFVDALDPEERKKCLFMLNLDSLGLGMPQVDLPISTGKLSSKVVQLAERMKIPVRENGLLGSSDSASFIKKNVPAVTIHGLKTGYDKILHTVRDQKEMVSAEAVYLTYRLALGLLVEETFLQTF